MHVIKGAIVKVRDSDGRIVGKARVGNYYPGTRKYHIEFLYPTGEHEDIEVPAWNLVSAADAVRIAEPPAPVRYSYYAAKKVEVPVMRKPRPSGRVIQ